MSRQAEARKQNKDLIRGNINSETATDSTCVDLVEPHKKDLKSAMKPKDEYSQSPIVNVCGVVDGNTNGNHALQRTSLVTTVTREDIFKLFLSPRNRWRNAGPSTKW